MNKILKNWLIAIAIAALLVSVGVFIYFVIPKPDKATLNLEVPEEVDCLVGQSKKLDYVLNIKKATVSVRIDKTFVAEYEFVDEELFINGKSEGVATLTIIASYNNQKIIKSVSIVITKENAPVEEELDIEINLSKGELSGNEITLNLGELSILTIKNEIDEDCEIEITTNSENLEVVPTMYGNRSYRIKGKESGEYILEIKVGEKSKTYKITVN